MAIGSDSSVTVVAQALVEEALPPAVHEPPAPPMSPPNACHQMPSRLALTASKVQAQSNNGTVFLTFADGNVARFALNWAWLLQQLGLRTLVGISGHLERSVEVQFREVGARVFCADGPLMALNGQAGRWSEVLPVLRLARAVGVSVLLSDADIAWMRNPLPYFDAVRAAHPRVDLLMMTDRAFNGYETQPLRVQPAGSRSGVRVPASTSMLAGMRRPARSDADATSLAAVGVALELEPGYESAISYNIGVMWFGAHALAALEGMVERFSVAVGGGAPASAAGAVRGGRAMRPTHLASWDQEPINKQVLQVQLRHDDQDRRLVRVDRGRVAMGVLPMLQFTTSFTYFMHRKRREMVGAAPPYCLHAIFAHGKETARKMVTLPRGVGTLIATDWCRSAR